jgi:hypothetical protein
MKFEYEVNLGDSRNVTGIKIELIMSVDEVVSYYDCLLNGGGDERKKWFKIICDLDNHSLLPKEHQWRISR